jgi:phospholipase C
MADVINQIETIIIVMLENRSFDHMLGYRSLPPWNHPEVEGLSNDPAWKQQFANYNVGTAYETFQLADPRAELAGDPQHERTDISLQLGPRSLANVYPMNGFVANFPDLADAAASGPAQPLVMGYFDGDDLPTTHFLAEQFTICDHWFSSLPAGTQPNRLMSMSGSSKIEVNQSILLPDQRLVYDWLNERGIRWRVYHDGIPFFAMMERWIPTIMTTDHFKSYNQFRLDMKGESDTTFPQVIFIEPRYTDAPHLETPTDDHAPSPVTPGQNYLMRIYGDVVANPARWAKTVLIVTYDEHGGFFDHVSPPMIATQPPAGVAYTPFPSLGVRVPGYIISPFAVQGGVFKGTLDHLSILKFIGEKFGGGSYSVEVDARPVASVSAALTLTTPRPFIPYPPQAGYTPEGPAPEAPIPSAFKKALDTIKTNHPAEAQKRFPELIGKF